MAATARKIREFQRREEDILDAALELCSQPDWETVSVEQIADRAGFGSAANLRKHLSRQLGTTPRAYRSTFRA